MTLLFSRSYPFQTELSNKARFFILKISIPGEIHPDSGMSVSLVHVDEVFLEALKALNSSIPSENEALRQIFRRLPADFSKAELELEEPASQRSWGLVGNSSWLEKKLWVTLRGEKKVLILKLRSRQEIANNRLEYQSLSDLRRQLEGFADRLILWDIEDPVTGILRGY